MQGMKTPMRQWVLTQSNKMELPGHSRVNSEDYVFSGMHCCRHYEREHVSTQQQNRFLNLTSIYDRHNLQ